MFTEFGADAFNVINKVKTKTRGLIYQQLKEILRNVSSGLGKCWQENAI
jgi:hypothetical protein